VCGKFKDVVIVEEKNHNKALQIDNSRGIFLVVSLSLNFTTRKTPRELRLKAALE